MERTAGDSLGWECLAWVEKGLHFVGRQKEEKKDDFISVDHMLCNQFGVFQYRRNFASVPF